MTDLIDDDWSEAVDANIPRVDLVSRAANGSSGFLLMKQDASGLIDAAYIRDLIAKSEPEPEETVTMTTGSPAAIARLIHERALAKAAETTTEAQAPQSGPVVDVEKAKYDAEQLRDLEAKGHAMKDPGGDISYPIADDEDLDAAIRAVGRGGEDHNKIRRFIERRAEEMGRKVPDNWASDGSIKKADGMDMDEGIDGMDPTVILACPEDDAPGDPNDPGSPAWEAIDAATAMKWTSILSRAKAAIDTLAQREWLEAASADPDDAENAMDLEDACCALDYIISVLAPFAIAEQSEADCGSDMMAAVGKALGDFDTAPLDTIEAFTQIEKAGRVLSTANEAAIRGAVESLQKVLASLPAAPAVEESGQPVAKTANEEPDMPQPTTAEDATTASGQEPAMGMADADPKPVAGTAVTDMAKAAKPMQVAIYDANGNLVGTVDPAEITMLAPAKAPDAATDDSDAATADPEAAPAAEPPATAAELTPAPSAEAGTPADAVATDDDSNMTKANADAPQTSTTEIPSQDVFKGIAQDVLKGLFDDYSTAQGHIAAQQVEVIEGLQERNQALEKQVEELTKAVDSIANQPAVMAVMGSGAMPHPDMLRGQDKGGRPVATMQAEQLRKAWASSDDAPTQKRLGDQMQANALELFAQMRADAQRG